MEDEELRKRRAKATGLPPGTQWREIHNEQSAYLVPLGIVSVDDWGTLDVFLDEQTRRSEASLYRMPLDSSWEAIEQRQAQEELGRRRAVAFLGLPTDTTWVDIYDYVRTADPATRARFEEAQGRGEFGWP